MNRIITDLAVMDVADGRLLLREVAPGVTVDAVLRATEAVLAIPAAVETMTV